MSVVQSVIPISAALIVLAESMYLVELVARARAAPPAGAAQRCADGTH